MKQKKSRIVVLCCAIVVAMVGIFARTPTTPSVTKAFAHGMITDRNGEVLVSNDTVVGEFIGITGVEEHYDKVLSGEDGNPGKNLKLTIDYELQKYGEELMKGKTGSIVAIEPSTGEVLCMVSSPSSDTLLNRCIMSMYSPGGVFRAAQGLVLLSENIVTPEACLPRDRQSPTTRSKFWKNSFIGMIDNAKYGTVKNALDNWHEYMTSLGFGNRLGIDLPYEKRGMMPNARFYDLAYKGQWTGATIQDDAVGLGDLLVTPLQLANLSAIIANRGYYYIPHVVKEIDGEAIDEKYKCKQPTKVSSEVCETAINGMRSSAARVTSKPMPRLYSEVYGIAGTVLSKKGIHSAFIGFAPVDFPKIAITVYVEKGGPGPMAATPIGGKMMELYLEKSSKCKEMQRYKKRK